MTSAQKRRHPGARPLPQDRDAPKSIAAHDARQAIQPPTAAATDRIDSADRVSRPKNAATYKNGVS
jgi:hypothetical protein